MLDALPTSTWSSLLPPGPQADAVIALATEPLRPMSGFKYRCKCFSSARNARRSASGMPSSLDCSVSCLRSVAAKCSCRNLASWLFAPGKCARPNIAKTNSFHCARNCGTTRSNIDSVSALCEAQGGVADAGGHDHCRRRARRGRNHATLNDGPRVPDLDPVQGIVEREDAGTVPDRAGEVSDRVTSTSQKVATLGVKVGKWRHSGSLTLFLSPSCGRPLSRLPLGNHERVHSLSRVMVRDINSRHMYSSLTSTLSTPHLLIYPYLPSSISLLTLSSSAGDPHANSRASFESPSVSAAGLALWRSPALRAQAPPAREPLPPNAVPAREAERTGSEHWRVPCEQWPHHSIRRARRSRWSSTHASVPPAEPLFTVRAPRRPLRHSCSL
jgi:hypothetical protein